MGGGLQSINVLVVDDEPDLCMLLNEHLKSGYLVETFCDSEKGWQAQKAEPFDVLVLDLRMPGMDGLEFLRRLRETEAETEVVILTGNASLDSALEAIEHGIFAYLNKPVRFDQLRVVVDRAWQALHLRRKNRVLTEELAEANRKLAEEVESLARSLADSERAAAMALEAHLEVGLHLNLSQAFNGSGVDVFKFNPNYTKLVGYGRLPGLGR